MIADGVIPSNEGRGYVLRRLLRRAARNGKMIGIQKPFLYQVVDTVIKENQPAYPELLENADYIKKIVKAEEENFASTINKGLNLLYDMIDNIDSSMEQRMLSGDQAFKLYDTYGFPLDLIKEVIEEQNIAIDEERFMELMNAQKEAARKNAAANDVAWDENELVFTDDATEFLGYSMYECDATLKHIVVDGKEVETASEGQQVTLVFDVTPFYAESGGQVGDRGVFVYGDNIVNVTGCM